MNDFWQQLIANLAGNAVLVGLIGYLGKVYLDRIERNEQAAIDERLKRVEQEHETLMTKDEHFHQISQTTYQRLFDKKIEVYGVLSKLLNEYELKTAELSIDTEEEYYYFIYNSFKPIHSFMEANSLYLTPSLNRLITKWRDCFMQSKNTLAFARRLQNGQIDFKTNLGIEEIVKKANRRNALEHEVLIEVETWVLAPIMKDNMGLINQIREQVDFDISDITNFIHGTKSQPNTPQPYP